MDTLTIVEALPDERHDVRDGFWRFIRKGFEGKCSLRSFDHDDRNGLRRPRRQLRSKDSRRCNRQNHQKDSAAVHALALAPALATRREILVTPTRPHISASTQSEHRG